MQIGVLVPALDAAPGKPEDRPIGRAALRLAREGVQVVFGHHAEDGVLHGMIATPGAYRPGSVAPAAVYDRFPSRTQPHAHAALRAALRGLPWANPPALVDLCSDKLACQAVLEAAGLPVPPVQPDPAQFSDQLHTWGAAFLKPRYGAFGRGVRLVAAGDVMPTHVEGAVVGELEPAFLQRAVPPPAGVAGYACRVLVQRLPDHDWWVETPVARRSHTDPVVNAARGAEVLPLSRAIPEAIGPVQQVARDAAMALARQRGGTYLAEVGVDVVIDDRGAPWVIEVNSRPRGRLEALADQDPDHYAEAHVQACARPLRFLAAATYHGAARAPGPEETP